MKSNFENIDLEKTESSFKSETRKEIAMLISNQLLRAVFGTLYKDLKDYDAKRQWVCFKPSKVVIRSGKSISREAESGPKDIAEALQQLAATLYHLAVGQSEWTSQSVGPDAFNYEPIDSDLWPLMKKMLSGKLQSFVEIDEMFSPYQRAKHVLLQVLTKIWHSLKALASLIKTLFSWIMTMTKRLFAKPGKLLLWLINQRHHSLESIVGEEIATTLVLCGGLALGVFFAIGVIVAGIHNGEFWGLAWFLCLCVSGFALTKLVLWKTKGDLGLILPVVVLIIANYYALGIYLPDSVTQKRDKEYPRIIIRQADYSYVAQAPDSDFQGLPYLKAGYYSPWDYKPKEGLPLSGKIEVTKELMVRKVKLNVNYSVNSGEGYADMWTRFKETAAMNSAIKRVTSEIWADEKSAVEGIYADCLMTRDPQIDYASEEYKIQALTEDYNRRYGKLLEAVDSRADLIDPVNEKIWQELVDSRADLISTVNEKFLQELKAAKDRVLAKRRTVEANDQLKAYAQIAQLVGKKLKEYFPYLNFKVIMG